jgi:hypothetical protein
MPKLTANDPLGRCCDVDRRIQMGVDVSEQHPLEHATTIPVQEHPLLDLEVELTRGGRET